MSSWNPVSLGEVLTLQRGFDLPKSTRVDGPYEVISASGVHGNHAEAKVPGPGVVTGRSGTIGLVHLVDNDFWPLNTTLYVKDFKGNDVRFCYYLLQSLRLGDHSVGAAVPSLNRNHVHGLKVHVPSVPTQERIATILGAYDDLIEVNRRRVAVLEEMARGLFDEWFVRFRFPGHEAVPIVDTPDGPLPEGWEFAPLQDFLILQRGFDLPTSKRTEGEVPVFSASGRHGSHDEAKVAAPGVVTGRSGTIGQVHLVWDSFWPLNTTLYVREFKRAGPIFAFLLLQRMDLEKHASGAAVPTLNRNHVHGIRLPAPPSNLVERFEAIATSIYRLIQNLDLENEGLSASRDLLLPRLISGQLSVEIAERQLEDAA